MCCEVAAVQPAPCRPETACLGCSVALIFADGPVCDRAGWLLTLHQLTRDRAARFLARPPDPRATVVITEHGYATPPGWSCCFALHKNRPQLAGEPPSARPHPSAAPQGV